MQIWEIRAEWCFFSPLGTLGDTGEGRPPIPRLYVFPSPPPRRRPFCKAGQPSQVALHIGCTRDNLVRRPVFLASRRRNVRCDRSVWGSRCLVGFLDSVMRGLFLSLFLSRSRALALSLSLSHSVSHTPSPNAVHACRQAAASMSNTTKYTARNKGRKQSVPVSGTRGRAPAAKTV